MNETTRRSPRWLLLRWSGWFYLGTGVLFSLLSLRYLEVAPEARTSLSVLFRASMIVTQGTLLAVVLLVLTAPLVLIAPRRRFVMPFALTLTLLALTVTLVDTFVYQQYRFHLDASVWRLLTDGAAATTFQMPASTHLAFGALVGGMLVVLLVLAWTAWRWTSRRSEARHGIRVAVALALVFVLHNGVHVWASAAGYNPVTQQVGALPLHLPLTARRAMRKLGIEVDQIDVRPGQTAPGLDYPLAELRFQTPEAPRNVVMIVIESWRYDAFSPRATPNLHALAAESVRFEDHHSGGNATRIGLFSLFYGIPGTYWHDVLAERRPCMLIESFQEHGYEVGVFRSAPVFSPPFDDTIFADVQDLRRESDGSGAAERDRDLTDDFIAWLDRRDDSRPFFTLLFYDAPHAYDVPPGFPREFEPSWEKVRYLELDEDTDPVPLRNLYLNSVRWVDQQAGRAIDALRARGLLERSTVVVTSDHGQEFNDLGLGYWGHNSNFAAFQSHVPLFMRTPGVEPRVVRHLTSHFDVPVTLLTDVLGCLNAPEDYAVGRPLLDPSDRGALTMASYNDFAAVLPRERHVVVTNRFRIEVLGPDYRPVPWEEGDAVLLEKALAERSRFRPGSPEAEERERSVQASDGGGGDAAPPRPRGGV